MKTAIPILQIIVALGLLNVWLLRFNRSTAYRGGQARSMAEEFAAYGLPGWFTYVVGALKVGGALCLITGIWFHSLVFPAALVIGVLMVGALAMHLKIEDPLKKVRARTFHAYVLHHHLLGFDSLMLLREQPRR